MACKAVKHITVIINNVNIMDTENSQRRSNIINFYCFDFNKYNKYKHKLNTILNANHCIVNL